MIELRNKKTGQALGRVTEEQLRQLVESLEEEFDEDRDYFFDGPTIDYLHDNGLDAELLRLLREALGEKEGEDEGLEIEWVRV